MLSKAPDTRSLPLIIEAAAWFVPLPAIAVTRATGPDTVRFLQGQLSCNVQKLDAEHALRGALCNLKGRVIADLLLVHCDDGILMLSWHGMQTTLLLTLERYRVFFKTSLQPADAEVRVFGLGGSDVPQLERVLGFSMPQTADQTTRSGAMTAVRLPTSAPHPARFLLLLDTRVDNAAMPQALAEQLPELAQAHWDLADLRDGIVHIRPQQSAVYTPQLLNYDINGVIDFKKGCYTGQEIVARMHYRAEAKRRLFHLSSSDRVAFDNDTSALDAEDIVVWQELPEGPVESLVVLSVQDAGQIEGIRALSDSGSSRQTNG